jgi:D-arabinose 1-dehydrogenase-like Zn-dependent alcohol dehydrogenase
MESSEENYEHMFYKHVSENEADAIAYTFVSKEKFVKFPFQFTSELEPNEIRANVLYTGMCLSDAYDGRGKWGYVQYPLTPGHEIIAEVSQIGSEVSDFKVGQKVGFGVFRDCCEECKWCKQGRENLCEESFAKYTYGVYWGGYATQIQQPAKFFFQLPDGLDLERAAPLFCAGTTVYTPIRKNIRKGDKCAVIGIGGLGHMAVQYLSKMGHEVTAITSSIEEKKELLLKLGCSSFIDSSNLEEVRSNANKFDFIINTLPVSDEQLISAYIELIATAGIFVQVGSPEANTMMTLSGYRFGLKEAKIIGSSVGSRNDVRIMLEDSVKMNVYPMIELVSFEEVPKALEKLENGKPKFRLVINVGDYSKKHNLFK